jgi:predicted Zn-dependent protease with MMP-like domain
MTPPPEPPDPHDDTDGGIESLDEQSFDDLEDRVERLAAQAQSEPTPEPQPVAVDPSAPLRTEADFENAVRIAINELPDQFQNALEDVAVVVSDEGASEKAYGMYVGRTAARSQEIIGFPTSSALPDEIIIYRDTLTRDFGRNPAELRAQIARTVRHEVAHHFGFHEPEVRGLGL